MGNICFKLPSTVFLSFSDIFDMFSHINLPSSPKRRKDLEDFLKSAIQKLSQRKREALDWSNFISRRFIPGGAASRYRIPSCSSRFYEVDHFFTKTPLSPVIARQLVHAVKGLKGQCYRAGVCHTLFHAATDRSLYLSLSRTVTVNIREFCKRVIFYL